MYLYMVSWWYIRKCMQNGTSSAQCRDPNEERDDTSPWQNHVEHLGKISKSEPKSLCQSMTTWWFMTFMSLLPTKKIGSKTSLSKSRFRRMASIPNNSSFQLIELIESGRLSTHFAMAQAVFNWRRLRLAGSSKWQDDPSHQKTTATRQTHAKKWKQQISPFPFKSANLWQPPTLHLNISSLAGSLDLIGLKPSDNATIQGYLVIHLGKNSQPHR